MKLSPQASQSNQEDKPIEEMQEHCTSKDICDC